MLGELYLKYETLITNLSLTILFLFMGMAVHDVLKKNDVPMFGRIAVYFVLGLGCLGFLAKGIIQYMWEAQGVG